jgi:hypothetical protein
MDESLFRDAVSAIGAGDLPAVERLLAEHPELVRERLPSPGAWLRDKVGDALDGFFREPYLLWFVAEDPVRNGKLPKNISAIARAIIRAAEHENVASFPEQIAYTLRLVCWSWIARECGVQIQLIDVLLDAVASPDGTDVYEGRYGSHADAAIYNKNFAAAEHLLERGATPTLTTVVCLNRWVEAAQLFLSATRNERENAFVQAAMGGNAEALRRMLALGCDPTTVSGQNQSHATALHHAVWSGSLDAVQVLTEAGADLTRRDTIYDATPLGWAEYGKQDEIAAYLRGVGAK